ncbi:UAA transporter [Russula earlei]|uniref:UAA transporter n=1 Tax=Russula earlei TaxID=71964 RepID=A0ACC0UAD5_9AGAM|nr:UAA transporter [Russula earlei]
MFRRRTIKEDSRAVPSPDALNSSAGGARDSVKAAVSVTGALLDYSLILFTVFGGCCSNVWVYEELLRTEPSVGPALTFSQMLFISAQQLPSFVSWDAPRSWSPRLKPRQVPIAEWLLQVVTFASGTLLNNLVFAFSVPPTLQIVFRSAGLAVSMLIGRFFMGKRYTLQQILAVAVVSSGVVIATLSRPRADPRATAPSGVMNQTSPIAATGATATAIGNADASRYTLGIAMLVASLLCTGVHGALQERTYSRYGPCWREGVFYTHLLSLPMFAFMPRSVHRGFAGLSDPKRRMTGLGIHPYAILALNMLSQLICVSGVNQLSSRASAVSTQVVLTARKAISLCFSVWWFGSGWNMRLACGASMVIVGSFWYSVLPVGGRLPPDGRREKRS